MLMRTNAMTRLLILLVLLGACAYLAATALVNRQLLTDARRFVIQFDRLESA